MRVHTKTVWDMATGEVIQDEWFEYKGPCAMCDRSVQGQAGQMGTGERAAAGGYGSEAGSSFGAVFPTISRWAQGETPGFGAMGLSQMLTANEATATAARQGAAEQARLRAMRTGNMAGLNAAEAGIAGATGRGAGLAVQDILAKNAALKEAQQEKGLGMGMGLYGTAGKLEQGEMGLANQSLETKLKAGQAGWLQNLMGLMQAGSEGAGGLATLGAKI